MAQYILGSSPSEVVEAYVVDRDEVLALLKANLVREQNRMKSLVDKSLRELTFQIGDWVYVKLKPYRQNTVRLQQYPKLSRRYFGPFKILKRIGEVSYKLELPEAARIHPVFHISMLKQCVGEPAEQITPLYLTNMTGPGPGPDSSLNLEDKVPLHGGSIIVTHQNDIEDTSYATLDPHN